MGDGEVVVVREGEGEAVRAVRMGWGKRSMLVAPRMLAAASRARASWMVVSEDMVWWVWMERWKEKESGRGVGGEVME